MTDMENGERGPGSPRHRIGEKILAAADKLVTPRRDGLAPDGRKPWTRRHPVLSRAILIVGVLAVAVAFAIALASGSLSPQSAGAQTITYIVSGDPANVTYGPAGSSLNATCPCR